MHPDKSGDGDPGTERQGRSPRRRRRSQKNRKRHAAEQQPNQQGKQQNAQVKQPQNQTQGRQAKSQTHPAQQHKDHRRPSEAARAEKSAIRDEQQFAEERQSRANMIVLVDSDPAYMEMESLAVVNYVSGFNPMSFTALDKALSYVTNPRNEGRIRMVLLSLETICSSGVAVTELLEAMRRHGRIPLVAVSESNSAGQVEYVQSLGAVGFLPKAFTMDVFVRFVKDVLRKGYVTGWQCTRCGKLVPMDQVDLLNMRPIRCTHRDCVSSEIQEVNFGEPVRVKAS